MSQAERACYIDCAIEELIGLRQINERSKSGECMVNAEGTDNVREKYERELRELRQDLGCTPERLMASEGLLQALRERASHQNRDGSLSYCVAELRKIGSELSDEEEKEALLVALGFENKHQGGNLTARRESYQAELASEKRWAHVRTLQHREDRAIKTLALLLADDPLRGVQVLPGPHIVRDFRDVDHHPDLQTLTWSSIYHISASGVIYRQDIRRTVRALTPDARPLVFDAHQYLAESRRGVLEFHADYGCRVVAHQEADSGAVVETFEIYKQLRPEDAPYSLGYHVLVNSDKPSEPIVRWKPDPPFSLSAEFTLIFHPQLTPVRAWWFATRNSEAAQIEPKENEGRHLELLDDGCYVHRLFDGEQLEPNLHRGIAWVWPVRVYTDSI
ncbi:hypothetical protein ACIBEJ_10265 [Nonomuraea sp. NPDC050790]|uniref:hypothetical protein n=1 Tax=Nonomuraea sp. NPDC050790 TaxID=3364371 RepID=UPI0037A43E0E